MSSSEEYLDSLLRSVTGETSDTANEGNSVLNENSHMPSMTELFNMEQDIDTYPANSDANNFMGIPMDAPFSDFVNKYDPDEIDSYNPEAAKYLQNHDNVDSDNAGIKAMPSMSELFQNAGEYDEIGGLDDTIGESQNEDLSIDTHDSVINSMKADFIHNSNNQTTDQIMHNSNGEYYFGSKDDSANDSLSDAPEGLFNDNADALFTDNISSSIPEGLFNNIDDSTNDTVDTLFNDNVDTLFSDNTDTLLNANPVDEMMSDISNDNMLSDMPEGLFDENADSLFADNTDSLLNDNSDTLLSDNPEENMLADLPEDTMLVDLPEDTMLTDLPEDTMLADLPEDTMLADLSEDTMLTDLPEDSMLADNPEDSMLTDLPEDTMITDLPEDNLLSNMPEGLFDDASASLGAEVASDSSDNEKINESFSSNEFLGDDGSLLTDEMLSDIAEDDSIDIPDDLFADLDSVNDNSYESSTIIPENVDLENLDDLLSSFNDDIPSDASDNISDISDLELNDMLSGMEDDRELSEIGDILNKNDNQEALDSSAFMNDDGEFSELDSLFSDEDVSEDVPKKKETKEERKARKQKEKEEKKRAKEEKKRAKKEKKGAGKDSDLDGSSTSSNEMRIPDDITDIEQLDELGFMNDGFSDENPDNLATKAEPDDKKNKREKKGFFSKVFDALTEEIDENNGSSEDDNSVKSVFAEEEATDIAKSGAEDNEKILSEIDEEDGKKKKKKKTKEKKEKKKKEKKEKAPKEKKEKVKDNTPIFLIPIKKVIVIMICCLSLGALICVASIFIPYSMDMKKAQSSFDNQRYGDAFLELTGHALNADEQLLYDKTVVLYKVDRKYESYENYMKLGMRTEALNALVQGVETIDKEQQNAQALGITNQFELLALKITNALQNTFAVSTQKAREWLMIEDPAEYSKQLDEYANGSASDGVVENPVIAGEEAEFSDDSSY